MKTLTNTELENAYNLGINAADDYMHVKEYSANPYEKDSDLSKSWVNGFNSRFENFSKIFRARD